MAGSLVNKGFYGCGTKFRVPSSATNKNKANLDEKSKFVLFFTGDYFGLCCVQESKCFAYVLMTIMKNAISLLAVCRFTVCIT